MSNDYLKKLDEINTKKPPKPETKPQTAQNTPTKKISELSPIEAYKIGYATEMPKDHGKISSEYRNHNVRTTIDTINKNKKLFTDKNDPLSFLNRGKATKTLEIGIQYDLQELTKPKTGQTNSTYKNFLELKLNDMADIAEAYNELEGGIRNTIKNKLLKGVEIYKKNLPDQKISQNLNERLEHILEKEAPKHKETYKKPTQKQIYISLFIIGTIMSLLSAPRTTGMVIATSNTPTNPYIATLFIGVVILIIGTIGAIIQTSTKHLKEQEK